VEETSAWPYAVDGANDREESAMKIQRTLPPTATLLGWCDLWDGVSGWAAGEGELRQREKEFSAYFGVKHVFFVSSGKAALYLILRALQSLNPGRDQVVIPAYTCFSVPSAIVKTGLTVMPCDIDPHTFDFDHGQLKNTIGSRTLCVVAGHLFGIPSDIERIKQLCHPHGIVVIEDAAQAMGGTVCDSKLGTMGDVGFFSFGRGKNITCGTGGGILTDSETIATMIGKEYENTSSPTAMDDVLEFLKLLMQVILIRPSLYWLPAALPFLRLGETVFYKEFQVHKLSECKAGILRRWRQRLESSNSIRQENACSICETVEIKPAVKSWESIAFLRLPLLMRDREMRDRLFRASQEIGAGLSRMYPAPVNEIVEIKDQMKGMNFPVAKSVADRLLNIPTHWLLLKSDRERICELLSNPSVSQ
jgi:perosamine synthetase